ncbi:MAG TPA: type II toxin-antitoxin system VapC family toxin [Beijerinckiaceae bacterium]|nr:type II toxin-antitoxin system VapC family toxin [Beijerinckiaceae bacterium]
MIESPVYIDANVFIYAMESEGELGMLARRWLMQADRGRIRAVTSELTIIEVLPHPLSAKNDILVGGYRRLLSDRPTLRVSPVSSDLLFRAAELRADLKSETPDAIHLATALGEGCVRFLTNDTRLKLPPEIARCELADVMALDP